ncbi:hypothetical protein GCM10010297_22930 [Streptomyces malachitofuscus]|nr:hypothetical protein GCM10010297_22930 [Streptomyces malachitofuscus]
MPACANIAQTDNHARQLREAAHQIEQRASHLPTPLAERHRLKLPSSTRAKRHHDQRITTPETTP